MEPKERELARRAHRAALMVAHFEDLRALLNSWRYLHRWVAALMVLLLVVHVVFALAYGGWR
jgi:cytochrome b561